MQTSSKKLSAYQQKKLVDQFVTLLADLNKTQEAKLFFSNFLTKTEQSVFSKRLAIIWLLHQDKSYQEIRKKLHVSSATISSVAGQMNQAGIKLAIDKIEAENWAEKWSKKILKWLPLQ